MQMLVRGDRDMLLGPANVADIYSESVAILPLMRHDMSILVSSDHPWSSDQVRTVAELADLQWILPTGTFIRRRFEQVFKAHGIAPPLPQVEVNDVACALDIAARSNLAILASPVTPRGAPWERLRRIPCPELETLRPPGVILRKHQESNELCDALIRELRASISGSALAWSGPAGI